MLHRFIAGFVAVVLAASTGGEARAACKMKTPDTSLAGVTLADSASAVAVVGTAPEVVEVEDDLPHARFVTSDGSEELKLFVHPGANVDEYGEFEVGMAGSEALVLKDLPMARFTSGRGVALGASPAEVVALFGTCFKSREKSGDAELIQYELKRRDMGPELTRFNYDLYYAEYEFTNGKLVRFRFGFENP